MTDDKNLTNDPGPEKASGDVDPKGAGKKTGPPGNADLDQDSVTKGEDSLGRVEAGH